MDIVTETFENISVLLRLLDHLLSLPPHLNCRHEQVKIIDTVVMVLHCQLVQSNEGTWTRIRSTSNH